MTDNTMTVPAHIIKRMEARKADPEKRSAALDAIVSDSLQAPRISTKSSRFRLVDAGVETVMGIDLDAVVVGVNPNVSKTYFDKPYDPNSTDMSPACSSDNGKVPDERIQSPVSDNCALCPMNVIGSKVTENGTKVKACSDHRNLAVVAAGDPSKVYALSVPVSGMTGLREYFKHLSNYGAIPEEVVTTLGFDPAESYPKLTFTLKSFLAEKHIANIEKIAGTDEVKIATREIQAPSQAALGAPTSVPTAAPATETVAAEPVVAAVEPVVAAVVEATPKPEPVVEAVAETVVVGEDATPVAETSDLDKALDDMFS